MQAFQRALMYKNGPSRGSTAQDDTRLLKVNHVARMSVAPVEK
jgi:hypothetical protein